MKNPYPVNTLISSDSEDFAEIHRIVAQNSVYIERLNCAVMFTDLGGIIIEDDVLIAPRVNILTVNHPLDATSRREFGGGSGCACTSGCA